MVYSFLIFFSQLGSELINFVLDRFKNYFGKFKTSKAAEEKAAAAKAAKEAKVDAKVDKKAAKSSSSSSSSSSSTASAKKEKATTDSKKKGEKVPEKEPEVEKESVEEESSSTEEENPFLAPENETEDERNARIEAILKAVNDDSPPVVPAAAAPVPMNRSVRLGVKNIAVERAPMSLDEKMDARKRLVFSFFFSFSKRF